MSDEPHQLGDSHQGQDKDAESRIGHQEKVQAGSQLQAFFHGYDDLFLLTGPADTGKTSLISTLLAELEQGAVTAILDGADLPEDSLFKSVCRHFGLPGWSGDWDTTLSKLSAKLRPYAHAFLVIDNAHELAAPAFDDIRLLSYMRSGRGPLLQVILVGREELLAAVEASVMARLGIWQIQRSELRLPRGATLYAVETGAEDLSAPGPEVFAESPAQENALDDDAASAVVDTIEPEPEQVIPEIDAQRGEVTVEDVSRHDEPEPERLPATASVSGEENPGLLHRPLSKVALLLLVSGAAFWLLQDKPEPPATDAGEAVATSKGRAEPLPKVPEPPALDRNESPPLAVSFSDESLAVPTVAEEVAQQADSPASDQAETGLQGPAVVHPESEEYPEVEVVPEPLVEVAEPLEPEVPVTDGDEPAVSDEINRLLAAAEEAIALDFLRTPPEQSAWNYYNQVLLQQPGNVDAQRGLQEIVDRYVVLTERALEREKLIEAETYVNRGLAVAADHRKLYTLETELQAAVSRRAELQAQESLREKNMTVVETRETQDAQESPEPEGLMGFLKKVFTPEEQADQQ